MIREDNHEAIIDKRTFERVQTKLAKESEARAPTATATSTSSPACYAAATAAAQ